MIKTKLKDKLYRIRGKGQWTLAKNIGGKSLSPLNAVRRKEKGPKGEPKGSIATRQKEVDQIARAAYTKIYKGNFGDIKAATKTDLEDYAAFIYEGPEAKIDPFSGRTSEATGGHSEGISSGHGPVDAG